jgi:hypothetical protein
MGVSEPDAAMSGSSSVYGGKEASEFLSWLYWFLGKISCLYRPNLIHCEFFIDELPPARVVFCVWKRVGITQSLAMRTSWVIMFNLYEVTALRTELCIRSTE